MIYLIGSLRNPAIPTIANTLRSHGLEVFDDWHAAGPHADDAWRDYEKQRGHTFEQALNGLAAQHVFSFDYHHLDRATTALLVWPAGKSAHIELGWAIGRGKKGYVLLDNPERWDVMLRFCTGVTADINQLIPWLKNVER